MYCFNGLICFSFLLMYIFHMAVNIALARCVITSGACFIGKGTTSLAS